MSLFYVSPLIISAALGLFLALFIIRNRPAPGSLDLAALILGASLWSAGYALELLSPGLESKLFWAKFQYLGIGIVPLTWFVFTLQYLDTPGWARRLLRLWPILAILPGVTIGLVWTNQVHGLIWQQVQVANIGPVQMLQIQHGPWFWVYWIYSYCLLILGSIRLVSGLLGTVRLHRWQVRLALVAILFPWIGNLAYVTDLNPVPGLDWTPFGFTIAGLLFVLSLFRFQLVKILPIAEKRVFAGLPDCLLVLDLQNYIVDLNLAAQKMIGNPGQAPFGKPLAEVMPELAGWVSQAGSREEFQVEIVRGEKPDQHFHELSVISLHGLYSIPVGRLVVCHEITGHKQQQALLEQTVTERTEELRQTVEQLQEELTQRTLAEKRFEEVIESAPDAMLLVDQTGKIRLVNAQTERLFGWARDELLGRDIIDSLVPAPYRDRQRSALMQFAADPATEESSINLDLYAQRKDGSELPVEISLSTLNTREGQWVACNVRDVTGRKKAEEDQNRLMDEIQRSREQLAALASRMQEVQEIERRQIANELHDRIGQNLTGLNLNLQVLQGQAESKLNPEARSRLADSLRLVEETTRQVRDVMAELHPPMLEEYGLASALNWYCAIFSRRTGIPSRVIGDEFEPRLKRRDEMVLFRLVQEALNNVAKHAQASQVMVHMETSGGMDSLIVEDNGLGFNQTEPNEEASHPHWGLLTMQQRVTSIGGELSIDSAPGRGTRVCINLRRSQDDN